MTSYVISANVTTGYDVGSGDTLSVLAGESSGSIIAGGYESDYGTDSGAVVSSGGEVEVMSAGSGAGETVSAGGLLFVDSGGNVSGANVLAAGAETLAYGASATGVVLAGAEYSWGHDQGAQIQAGGYQVIEYGGDASRSVISSGGNLVVSGWVVSTTNYGGDEYVYSGAFASEETQRGGIEYVSGGATWYVNVLFGSQLVSSGGITTGTLMADINGYSGIQVVYSGGVSVDTQVDGSGQRRRADRAPHARRVLRLGRLPPGQRWARRDESAAAPKVSPPSTPAGPR
jgi:autotransporter passenger strand-loop-strand repeat protein